VRRAAVLVAGGQQVCRIPILTAARPDASQDLRVPNSRVGY
jgi:hypothetical protein